MVSDSGRGMWLSANTHDFPEGWKVELLVQLCLAAFCVLAVVLERDRERR